MKPQEYPAAQCSEYHDKRIGSPRIPQHGKTSFKVSIHFKSFSLSGYTDMPLRGSPLRVMSFFTRLDQMKGGFLSGLKGPDEI